MEAPRVVRDHFNRVHDEVIITLHCFAQSN